MSSKLAATIFISAMAVHVHSAPISVTEDEISPNGHWIERKERALPDPHKRLLNLLQEPEDDGEKYSWGDGTLPRKYSAGYTADGSHTYGGKTVMMTRYTPSNAGCCADCDCNQYTTVISDADLKAIVDHGDKFIRDNSYGKAWLETVYTLPDVLSVEEGNFFETIDRVREKAFTEKGKSFNDYDFDLVWKYANGGSTGGSAIPGGHAQRYMYDGSLDSFRDKIFPHEFTHNFGTGHAWQGGAEYGDNYDMTGGGHGNSAHVSAAAKHRFKWITDEQIAVFTPATLTTPTVLTIRPFDIANAPSTLEANEKLAVRLDTRFMGKPCPMGKVEWCPDWGEHNGRNPWVDCAMCKSSDHYLYISYRAHDVDGEAKIGASLHIAKYSEDGWVDATSFLDVRPNTPEQTDAFLLPGETYVFDGHSDTAIVIKALEVSHSTPGKEFLRVEVSYADGIKLAEDYQGNNAGHLCSHTLTCGSDVSVDLASAKPVKGKEGSSSVLVKVGELHEVEAMLRSCAAELPSAKVWVYDSFPLAQALYQSPLDIGAPSSLTEFCQSPVPSVLTISDSGVWWMDGEFRLVDYNMIDVGSDMKHKPRASKYPHYMSDGTGQPTHLHVVNCTIHYCRNELLKNYNGGGEPTGLMWVLSYGTEPGSGTSFNDYFMPVDKAHEDNLDVISLEQMGVSWLKGNGGHPPEPSHKFSLKGKLSKATHVKERIGQHSGRKWLAVSFTDAEAEKAGAELKLEVVECKIKECANGYYDESLSGPCETTCKQCPQGTPVSQPGYRGSRACYNDSDELTVVVGGDATHEKSGMYTKNHNTTHNGYPIYQMKDKFVLRNDRFAKGWYITVINNMQDGSGYMGDLKAPGACGCAVAPLPQLQLATPCDGCAANSKWSAGGGNPTSVSIVETNKAGSTTSTPGQDDCSCMATDRSGAGQPGHCADGGSFNTAGANACTWTGEPDKTQAPGSESDGSGANSPGSGNESETTSSAGNSSGITDKGGSLASSAHTVAAVWPMVTVVAAWFGLLYSAI